MLLEAVPRSRRGARAHPGAAPAIQIVFRHPDGSLEPTSTGSANIDRYGRRRRSEV